MSRAQAYVVGQFGLFALLALAVIVFPPGQPPLPRIVGFALILLGFGVIALAVWEHVARNRALPSVAPTPNTHADLVESGLYRTVRHPIYTGVLLGAVGVALAHGHIVPFVIALIIIVFFTVKSRYEESLLRAIYPQYDQYMKHTGRFLPFL